MPLLHRKPFIRQQPPPDLDPTERLFYCRVTNEIFRDYDEFFERTILCNSLVWSCYFTGKSGLTYQEALESEKKIRKNLQNFPDSLIVPLLYISSISSHQRIQDLCDDIYAYVKNRFFVGEIVDVVRNSGARLECRILDVKAPPQQNGMANGHKVDGDTIIISDSDDETPKDEAPVRKKEPLDPTLFRYKVEPIKKEMYESVIVRSYQISRNTSLFSQERLKLFLKLHTETLDGMIKLKANSRSKYNLLEKNFFNYFPDEPPRFHQSPANIRQTGRSLTNKHLNQGNGLSSKQNQIEAAKERERILKHRKELKEIEMKRAMMRKQQAETATLRRKEYEDKERQKEFFKKFVEVERIKKKEEKERIKLEKEKEREKIREEKRKYAERLKLWSKPRDDLECDDLQELPEPIPVKTRLSPECFGDALMILEFLYAFGALFDLKDEFPEGVTLEILEEALVGSDPEGPLCELIFFFLSAIFQAMAEEEEEVAKDQITDTEAKDLTEALDEDQDTTKSALLAVASLAAAWPQLHQGCSLKDLNLDSCTVSEILRLHILASGADVNNVNAKYRYQKQGGFDASDDPCMELRLNHPAILKKLSNTSVYALPPGEKLKLLHALCGKLLTLVTTRDFIEDYMEELRQAKQEFRELKAEQNKREREEAATRIRKRREEKLKEQELRMKDKQEKLKEDENSFDKSAGNEELDDLDTSSETKDAEQKDQDTASEDEATSLNKIGKAKSHIGIKDMKKKNQLSEGSTEKKEPLTANEETFRKEQQKREQELLLKIQEATACTNIFPLGRDRWYRRFWSFYSVPGLFVEEDYSGLTEDMLQPQPISQRDSSINSALNCNESSTSSVQENKEELESRKPVNKPNRWCYYSTSEQVDKLIEALNTRGHRESSLKEVLLQEKNKICQRLGNISSNRFNISGDVPPRDVKPVRGKSQISPDPVKASAEKQLELRLCDLLLDIEERIYQGTLGAIKVLDRQSWRTALEKCCYEFLFDETKENGAIKHVNQGNEEMDIDSVQKQNIKERLHGLKTDVSATSTNTNTPQSVTNTVHYLARALQQIEQGVERKYLKYPLGDADDCKRDPKSEKKKKEDRKKKDEDQSTERDDVSDSGRVQRTVLDRWRESLLSSGSLSQIFLHLSTLDRSIMWSRSIRNARCKVCRKKGDGENMLLCDGCDRGHHIYCVRPKLKFVPEGDWFCPECKPKQRSQRQLPKQRPSKDYEDEELEAEELEEEQEQGDTEEETAMSEEESVLKKGRTKVKLPLKTKGGKKSGKIGHKKGEGKTPKNQQSTPKNILTALKSGATTTGRKARSAPSMGNKSMSHLSNFNSPSSHETSLVELVSHQVKGRGRGKALKSLDNTPESSPFAFRPFSLDTSEKAPPGRRSQPQTSQHDPGDSKGKSKKRVSADISSVEQGSRRSSGRNYGVHEISACEQLVVELVRHDDSWPFMKVVSKLQVPDYFDIIKKPIALNVIREKVNNCEYKSASEFIEDIELMFSNCFEYNHINSNEAKAGFRLQSFFICEAKKLGLEVSTNKNIVPPLSKKSRL